MRKILLLFSGLALCSMASFAQVTSITVEEFYTDDASVAGYPAGFSTYRIYANCTNANDVVAAVLGNDESPLALIVGGGVFNHPGGGVLGQNLNCNLYSIIPALQYDSYVTLGRTCNTDPGNTCYTVQDPSQPWTTSMFNTSPLGSSSIFLNTVVGGAWFGLPGDPNAFAGADLKVLIAQITTDGSICGNFNLQVFPDWSSIGDPDQIQTNLSFGTGDCGTPGCTDPLALNFDSEAGFNNGICLYECAVDFGVLEANPPVCAGEINGSIYFEGAGGQDFIHYQFNAIDGGLSPDLYENLGNGEYILTISDTRFDNELFNPDGIYGTCSATEVVVFDVQPIVFGPVTPTAVSCGGLDDGCLLSSTTGGTGVLNFTISTCGNAVVATDLPSADFCGLAGGSFKFSVLDENGCTAITACVTVVSPPALTLNIGGGSDVSCFGSEDGQQVVSWIGGTGDVDFSLTDDGVYELEGGVSNIVLSSLPAGDYSIFGADVNGCEASATFSVGSPAQIVVGADLTSPSCPGDEDGALVATATGGDGSIMFSSDDVDYFSTLELTGLVAGTYTIFAMDGNDCAASADIELLDPIQVGANLSIQNISCFAEIDGGFTATGTGGTGDYTYSIDGESFSSNGSFADLASGLYSITVVDENGCVFFGENAIEIVEPAQIEATVSATDAPCNGDTGSITVDVTGGTPDFEFSIGGAFGSSNEFTDLQAGNYTITVVDASGCETTASASITEPDALDITGLTADPIDENAGGSSSYTVTGGTPPYSFEWTDSNGDVVSSVQSLGGLTAAADAGSYTVTITDDNGCTIEQTINITGLDEVFASFSVNLLPNPTMGQFMIRFTGLAGDRLQYRVLDTQGRTILFSDLGSAAGSRTEVVDITDVAAGIYYVQITSGDAVQAIKVIKQ